MTEKCPKCGSAWIFGALQLEFECGTKCTPKLSVMQEGEQCLRNQIASPPPSEPPDNHRWPDKGPAVTPAGKKAIEKLAKRTPLRHDADRAVGSPAKEIACNLCGGKGWSGEKSEFDAGGRCEKCDGTGKMPPSEPEPPVIKPVEFIDPDTNDVYTREGLASRKEKPALTPEAFREHLEQASDTVSRWPRWMQKLFSGKAKQ